MEYEIIYKSDIQYPQILLNIPDPPEKLYCIGNINLLNTKSIAIVGTRRSSPYGRWAAYELGKKIADCGVTLVSGMAEGIDTQGHMGALAEHGNTIAVLGTSIDKCFPKSNEKLYKQISDCGLIISEYGPEDITGNWSFPRRNRIISGLCESVIVVEGAYQSGSMITAKLAIEQSRNLFAVPGNINQPNSIGTNSLIRDGAIPILSIEDAIETLGLGQDLYNQQISNLSIEEAKIMECARLAPGIDEALVSLKCKLELVDTIRLISKLEIMGYIRKDGTEIYIR